MQFPVVSMLLLLLLLLFSIRVENTVDPDQMAAILNVFSKMINQVSVGQDLSLDYQNNVCIPIR